jgi:hypothetical protein
MNKVFFKYLAIIGFVAMFAGCASGVKQTAGSENAKLTSAKVTQVQISLTDEAQKLVNDNVNFSVNDLKAAIEEELKTLNLIQPDAGQFMEVTLKSFRARSAFSAIAFGFMSGSDNILGVMTIKDSTGKVLKSSEISASYALGGVAGGMTGTRMGWLYREFAKLSAQELNGTPAK